jgi:hypothetical protein
MSSTSTIFELKEQAVTETPLLLFECTLANGMIERWSTHAATVDGVNYAARVLQQNVFEMQTASAQGVDGIPQISLALANADSHCSEIERAIGWKGARLKASFLFYDLKNQKPASDIAVLFQGICNSPDEIRQATLRLTATNRMSLQRVWLPQVRIQRRCPWRFPATASERAEAVNGGAEGRYSKFYRCGYSAGCAGGMGTMNGAAPFTTCGYTRAECQARGMLPRFGGLEYVPPSILVRSSGASSAHVSAALDNTAAYNDVVPVVYGTAWYTPPVVFTRNDGNITRMEVLLGMGPMQGVLKVLVNDIEIPRGIPGFDMTATGWYNVPTLGSRDGAFNPDFPGADPYGSMAYLALDVPNQVNDGSSLPRVKVLAQGLVLPAYAADGSPAGEQFSDNPAWVLLDLLRRTGWGAAEIDIPSFAAAAAYCDEQIHALDIYGNPISLPRFRCNLALQKRRSAGEVARGIRTAARLMLTYGASGLLQLSVENAIALEQPSKAPWSNSDQTLNGGWPSYEFGDGSDGSSGILRRADGEPSVRVFSRSMADTPNYFFAEFQDELNQYQQDSFSVVNPDDVALSGQEISAALNALGMPNFNQAGRILKLNLDKSVRGNTYIEFDSSVKCIGVRPGDLIAVTYLKEGFQRQPFRVLKVAPATNHRTATITAQIHDDAWYADSNGQATSADGVGPQGGVGVGTPRPLVGGSLDEDGADVFGIAERLATSSDASVQTELDVTFAPPGSGGHGPASPLVSLSAQVDAGGTLPGGQALYYAVSAVDSDGNEGALSFIVTAMLHNDASTVTLKGLSFAPGTATFHAYRGNTPARLLRIATGLAPSTQFTDAGLAAQPAGPPDANFDHANFYWRMELQPEFAAELNSANSAGNSLLEMKADEYVGMTARITRGAGAGQERKIVSNSKTDIIVWPAWTTPLDAGSNFVVVESGWQAGGQATNGQAHFAIPNRAGEVAHITGRAANVNNVENAPGLSIVTRYLIGGEGVADKAKAPAPLFGFGTGKQGGTVEMSGIGFPSFTNTRSISSATLTLHYWDELSETPQPLLDSLLAADGDTLTLSAPGPALEGSYLQIDAEVLRVKETALDGVQYTVDRGVHGSEAAEHEAGAEVYHLSSRTAIAPFPRQFFGSRYSGGWSYPVDLPDARVASAELFVTNNKGNSPVASACLTHNRHNGLRTLSGGQYTIQVEGFLAVDSAAAPPLVMETSHAVGQIYAVLGQAADAEIALALKVNGRAYCTFKFDAYSVVSKTVDGATLPPLMHDSQITLSITSVGRNAPGADLTVVIAMS